MQGDICIAIEIRIRTKCYNFQTTLLNTFLIAPKLLRLLIFPELNKPPEVNDFVLIEINTLPKKYYVGKITKPEDADKDYEISYMRKKHFSFEFFPLY